MRVTAGRTRPSAGAAVRRVGRISAQALPLRLPIHCDVRSSSTFSLRSVAAAWRRRLAARRRRMCRALTGMRPGEVYIIRPHDIEAGGNVWRYYPSRHKLEHKEIDRVIPLGPQAQEIIKPFLMRDTLAYPFSPADAQRQRLETRHRARKTPEGYGNRAGTNRKEIAERKPGERYTGESYRKAIHHACGAAERALRETASMATFARWNPNQLRTS